MKFLKRKELLLRKMLNFIVTNKVTNYQELCDNFNLSRKTISNYLNDLDKILTEHNATLVRRQNYGIYVEGDLTKLEVLSSQMDDEMYNNSKEERHLLLLITLLSKNDYVTIQDLADQIYVSRSTLENDLRRIRLFLKNYNIAISTGRNGIKMNASDKSRRLLIKKITQDYFGGKIFINDSRNILSLDERWETHMQNLFDKDLLSNILETLNNFLEICNGNYSDYEIQALAIHLIVTVDNLNRLNNEPSKTGNVNFLVQDTIKLVNIIEKKFNVSLSIDQKQSINMHILAAQKKDDDVLEDNSVEIGEIKRFLKAVLRDDLQNEEFLTGLSIHLYSAIKRSYAGINVYNPYTDEVKKTFLAAYEEAVLLKEKIKEVFHVYLNDDECSFIALHYQSLFESSQYRDSRIKAIIICNYGIGSSRLLEQRINKYFASEIKILDVVSYNDFNLKNINADLLISTVPIEVEDIKCIVVSPVLMNAEMQVLKNTIYEMQEDFSIGARYVFQLLDSNLIFVENETSNKNEVIKKIGEELATNGYADIDIVESAINREKISTTAFENVALPHGDMKYIKQSKIVILVNKKGIQWGNDIVNVVMFMALNKQVSQYISEVYQFITNVIDDNIVMKKLINCDGENAILNTLYEKANAKEK